MSDFFVTELLCPLCGATLDGLETDRVFACLECELGVEVDAGRVLRHPLQFAPPAKGTELTVVHLPFWKILVKVHATDGAGNVVMDTDSGSGVDSVWVNAFLEVRTAYLGNPGLDLTRRRACPLATAAPSRVKRLVGAGRTSAQATKYADMYVTDMLDRRKDVTGYHIEVKPVGVEYWAIPFAHDHGAGTLEDLTGGNTYKAVVVDGIKEILDS